MNYRDFCSSLFFLFLSFVVFFESTRLKFGTYSNPGPGFFPLVSGLILGVLSLLVLVQSFHLPLRNPETMKEYHPFKVAVTITSLVLYASLMELTGFLIVTFLFTLWLLRVVGRKQWSTCLLGAVIISVGCEVVFNIIFQANLPKGFIDY